MIEKLAAGVERFTQAIASVPDHLWALVVIATGSIMTVCKQHDTGQALVAAGLAMWRGQNK